jgi:hypothetical protein
MTCGCRLRGVAAGSSQRCPTAQEDLTSLMTLEPGLRRASSLYVLREVAAAASIALAILTAVSETH